MTSSQDRVLSALPVFSRGQATEWRGLRVEGLVSSYLDLSVEDLKRLAQARLVEDFRCDEGWVAPAQEWEGVPVAALLARVGVRPEARYVAFSAGDFAIGLSLEEALAPTTLMALRLNGQTLAPEHGGPCRLIVAGKTCYYNVKWVDRVHLTAEQPRDTAREIALQRIRSRQERPGRPPGT